MNAKTLEELTLEYEEELEMHKMPSDYLQSHPELINDEAQFEKEYDEYSERFKTHMTELKGMIERAKSI